LGAELVRFWIRRKPDWHLWVSLVIPLFSVLSYLPLIRTHSTMLFAREYRVTPLRMFSYYWESIRYVATPLALVALLALLWPARRKRTPVALLPDLPAISAPFRFLLASLALVPLAVGILFARTGTAFFDRYGVVWLIPFALVPALILGYRTHRDPLAGSVVVLALAAVFFFNTIGRPWLLAQLSNLAPARIANRLFYVVALFPVYPPPNGPVVPSYLGAELSGAPHINNLDAVEPELPFVANTGLSFLELDREESQQFTERLYLLTDEQAAAAIAHDTVFSHYERLKEIFPIRGTIEPYCTFVSAHPRFLVIGAYNHPQGWLLRKLDREGAKLRVLGTCSETYEDCQIYQISMASNACSEP
jgi:hypothetical protein